MPLGTTNTSPGLSVTFLGSVSELVIAALWAAGFSDWA
jgi:hypothetical protein